MEKIKLSKYEYNKKWKKDNREKINLQSRERYKKDPEKFKKQARDLYRKNLEKNRRISREYRKKNPEKPHFRNYRNNSKHKGLAFEISFKQFSHLTKQPCFYCGEVADSINGLDRVDNGKGYLLDNVVPCCEWCNRMKLIYSQEEFVKKNHENI